MLWKAAPRCCANWDIDIMDELFLIRVSEEYAGQICEYRQEFLDAGGSMDGCGPLRRYEDPFEYIKICRDMEDAATALPDMVPATQFMCIRKSDNRLVGMIDVRHYFNEYLEKYAGNIGYSVRPSERRKGYATQMLNKALPYCKSIGLDKVLVCCIDGNIGSEKTILANGGEYEYTVNEPARNRALKRFWIDT